MVEVGLEILEFGLTWSLWCGQRLGPESEQNLSPSLDFQ